MILPGVNLWGGYETHHNLQIPLTAINKWEGEFGWQNQHHIVRVPLYKLTNEGLNLYVDLANRIVEGEGYVHIIIWGTPKNMASVPVSWKDPNGRPQYPKYPPSDYEEWVELYFNVVDAFVDACGTEYLYFGVWHEVSRYYWRSSDRTYYRLYGVVQEFLKKYKYKLNFGGSQMTDLVDAQTDQQRYTSTPTLVWLERFFGLIKKYNWQVDFIDLFQYHTDPEIVTQKIIEIENLMVDYNIEAELFFNSIAPRSAINDTEEGARYTLDLAKMLLTETSVTRANFDFLEDSGRSQNNGLLSFKTLEEKPRWQAVRKIMEWGG